MTEDNARYLHIFLSAEGLERRAAGGEPYYWEYRIAQAGAPDVDAMPEAPKNCVLVAAFVQVMLPAAEEAAPAAVAELRRRKAEVYAQAQNEVQVLDIRIGNLLALSYTPRV